MRPYPPQFLVLLLSLVLLGGCVSQKSLPYLQSGKYSTQTPVTSENTRLTYRLQPSDVLSIRVQSVQPQLNDMFNTTDSRAMLNGDPGTLFLTGYSVDELGFINLPTVGRLKVQGMTVDEAQSVVQQGVAKYVRDANVLVKLLSFKITVLGEVRNPGRYFVYNAQCTVLEGLGLAGDLSEFGNRKNVKLIRQTANGSEVVLLDLTDSKLLSSSHFYLLPNDALYVEPMKARTNRGNATNLGLVFAGISTVALILNYIQSSK
ncbi:polysaccharide export outer membrane protein [Hymenobacter gelipurpurascens]|uniref:Polysaccharide export outer membrane protein n=1 Tax=Hymenobacter gelipurpurascens TaxID=89968 RepID=A0A212TKQ0_9BACT|nr:polysaccharide biosynthesis/export family protein [Hymenobacter gelipurpurascens]SNC66424.1 polysaccharide export outer membrane protein [Hymenobacter gelipurpurascens]